MPKKYQDEIEEILRRSEEEASADPAREPRKPARRTAPKPDSQRVPIVRLGNGSHSGEGRPHRSGRWPTITPGKLMLAGLVVFLVAALLRLSLGWVGIGTLIWVGLGMLAVGYLMFFIRPSSSSLEKRWRGQRLEERSSAWKRFTRWLRS